MSCSVCRYYKPAPEEIDVTLHGDCRHHSPVANPARKNAGEWPQVAARAWCGDFVAAVDRLADPEVRA